MDILSHALWAGAAAGAIDRKWPLSGRQVASTVALGLLPDLGQLLPVLAWSVTQAEPVHAIHAFVTATPGSGPALPPLVETLSHHLHCIAHSVIVLAVVTLAAWHVRPAALAPLAGWWLHVAIDIPTHSDEYYAVPFLYPLTYWGFDGIAWNTPWVLALNYTAIAAAYAALFITRGRRSQAHLPWK